MLVESWEVNGQGQGWRGEGAGAKVAKYGLRVEGYSQLSGLEFASWGSEPELRHASVQGSAGEGGGLEIAGRAILVYPNKEASSAVDRTRGDGRVKAIISLVKNPIQVVVGHLPFGGPAGGPTLSVQNLLPIPVGRAPGASPKFKPLRMQLDSNALLKHARATLRPNDFKRGHRTWCH